ncbi:MAG TPA: hypothetical protein VJS38_16690 [Phenylobacterium sp.]|uniref:hypothetical protein n=1 Tax=Phenylobacterium sp. TaxID=1871053 RepID=UPI002B47260E|nr:hypothetical protein [Phenylobacterium sp.]HKR89808.1 hypothetical protein [Phenylobacterium sp.]
MARKPVKRDDVQALDVALRSLFRNLEARALPDSLRADHPSNLLDQLCFVRPLTRLRGT